MIMSRIKLTPEEKEIRRKCRKCPYKDKVWLFMGDTEPTLVCHYGHTYHQQFGYCNPTKDCLSRQKDKYEPRQMPSWMHREFT